MEQKSIEDLTFEELERVLLSLSLNEIKFVVKCIDGRERTAYAMTNSEGSVAAKLSKKGLIRPFGKLSGKVRWQAYEKVLNHRHLIRDMAR